MEKVIELENALPKRSQAISYIFNDIAGAVRVIFKAASVILIFGTIFVGVDFAKQKYRLGVERLTEIKETWISEQVAASLSGKTINFEDKRGTATVPTAMSREELLRALYLLERQRAEKQEVINHLKDTLSFE